VPGRIKKKLLQAQLAQLEVPADKDEICPLCERRIPPLQRDAHHLVPKSWGGSQTAALHRICHRQIHALFTESELAKSLNTVEALKNNVELQPFIKWVRTKPDDFFERTRKSQRLKSK
jgi:hypothetical protein